MLNVHLHIRNSIAVTYTKIKHTYDSLFSVWDSFIYYKPLLLVFCHQKALSTCFNPVYLLLFCQNSAFPSLYKYIEILLLYIHKYLHIVLKLSVLFLMLNILIHSLTHLFIYLFCQYVLCVYCGPGTDMSSR